MMEEAGVGFEGGEVTSVDVVGFDFVAVCASVIVWLDEFERGI
jgi:hypothetical protein